MQHHRPKRRLREEGGAEQNTEDALYLTKYYRFMFSNLIAHSSRLFG